MPRAAEEIEVIPAQRRARLFLRAVADAGREAPMLPLGDRDECRHLGQLLRLVLLRLDVGELKQLHPVQLPLRLAHLAAREDLARLVRELPAEDVLANALLAFDFDGAEMRER